MSQAGDDPVSAASTVGAKPKSACTQADKRKAKTRQVRARLDAAGSTGGRHEKPIVTMQDILAAPAASAAASSSRDAPAASAAASSDVPTRVVMRVAVDCDIPELFARGNEDGSVYEAQRMLRDGYDVNLKARGRTNPNSRTGRPAILLLEGGREQMRNAYAALFEFVKAPARERKLLSTPEDTFLQFPLPPEDVALTRPGGSGDAAVEVFVDQVASADEVVTDSVDGMTVTRAHGVARLLRDTTLKLSLQDHLQASEWDVPLTVPVPPAPRLAPNSQFIYEEHRQFRRTCALALERVQAHASNSY